MFLSRLILVWSSLIWLLHNLVLLKRFYHKLCLHCQCFPFNRSLQNWCQQAEHEWYIISIFKSMDGKKLHKNHTNSIEIINCSHKKKKITILFTESCFFSPLFVSNCFCANIAWNSSRFFGILGKCEIFPHAYNIRTFWGPIASVPSSSVLICHR